MRKVLIINKDIKDLEGLAEVHAQFMCWLIRIGYELRIPPELFMSEALYLFLSALWHQCTGPEAKKRKEFRRVLRSYVKAFEESI